jgi:hypothetical protein
MARAPERTEAFFASSGDVRNTSTSRFYALCQRGILVDPAATPGVQPPRYRKAMTRSRWPTARPITKV